MKINEVKERILVNYFNLDKSIIKLLKSHVDEDFMIGLALCKEMDKYEEIKAYCVGETSIDGEYKTWWNKEGKYIWESMKRTNEIFYGI